MQLHDALPQIRALGAELVVVGNGQPFHARAFRDEAGLVSPLLVDPELGAYRAAGFSRALSGALNLRTLRHTARALARGFRQGSVQGDAWQLGGALVIAPGGRVVLRHASREAGDHPPVDLLLKALRSLAA